MPGKIEDYALIGDTVTAALVGRDGSIDWLCLPRFDSGSCFSALLGGEGRWLLAPADGYRGTRRYRGDTLILENDFITAAGTARVTDFMSAGGTPASVFRIVEGLRGRVEMRMELAVRFDYGRTVPWVRRAGDRLLATAGPDTLELFTDVRTRGAGLTTVADFEVKAGERISFSLLHRISHERKRVFPDPEQELKRTEKWWRDWSRRCTYRGRWRDKVMRSLLTLKALTYAPSGGILAAPTTSLPELIGGPRNWDYRYCWLRDATFTLYALIYAGYHQEARDWREWLIRAVAGKPEEMQILYGIAGERRLTETVLPWLPGYEGSSPVRSGNAAVEQFQLDVYGEVMDSMHLARCAGLHPEPHAWEIQKVMLDFLETAHRRPDQGIWEMRGDKRHFTHSKVMAWVAFDRAVKAFENFGLDGPVERWKVIRDRLHGEICSRGYDASRNTFTQSYGSKQLDASCLMLPLVGFLPASDPRIRGTVEAVRAELSAGKLLRRYRTESGADGLQAGEGVFLPCTFWLADNLAMQGRREEAESLFVYLLSLCNDVGLLSEEYDPSARRMLGNFPQSMTHVALVNTARNLVPGGPMEHRSGGTTGVPEKVSAYYQEGLKSMGSRVLSGDQVSGTGVAHTVRAPAVLGLRTSDARPPEASANLATCHPLQQKKSMQGMGGAREAKTRLG